MTNKSLSLLHLANFNSTNIGNGALINGTETVISQDMPFAVLWSPVAWDDYTFGLKPFDEKFVGLINQSDGMIVNGAVTMNGRQYLGNSGMRFDLPLELYSKIKKPLIFYGISYRLWKHQPYHHLDKLKQAIEIILNNPLMLFGVRNDGTKEWLDQVCGIASDQIYQVPDMGMFVSGEDGYFPQISEDKKNLVLAFNNEDAVNRYAPLDSKGYPVPDSTDAYKERRTHVLKQVQHAVERLVEKWDLNIILVPHYFDDFQMLDEFVTLTKPQIAHQHMVSTGLLPVPATKYFYGFYQKVDASVSMRVHSMSPSIGLGVPMVPLVTQDRMTMYLKQADIADWGINAFDSQMSEKLYAAVDTLLTEPKSVLDRFAAARSKFREQCSLYNEKVAALLGG